jgi:hypothetical protein
MGAVAAQTLNWVNPGPQVDFHQSGKVPSRCAVLQSMSTRTYAP